MRKIIVLGGQGFLGKHVMSRLQAKGFEPLSRSRRTGCDITQLHQFCAMLRTERPDSVINCAAHVGSVQYAIKNAADMLHDNMEIITNLYKGVTKECPSATVINPISNCTYPGEANIHFEPDWLNGPVHESVEAYGNPRRMLYFYSKCFNAQYGINSINWLVANAYGPGDYLDPNKVHALNGIIIRLLKARKNNDKEFEIWGTGKPLREWVYIEDAAKILADSLEGAPQIYPINIAQKKGYSVAEIASIAAECMDYSPRMVFNTSYADGAPTKILDDHTFRSKFPTFQFTPLKDGIIRTIEYYKNHF